MREIGGYIEFEHYNGTLFHEDAIKLNCGRSALVYLIKAKKIDSIWLPKLICDSVIDVCKTENISYSFYNIGEDFLPVGDIPCRKSEWIYIVNFYSQLNNEMIHELSGHYANIIIDNAQSYFQNPVSGIDTLYTCRKYFGVSDGAFLYTDGMLNEEYEIDESYDRLRFLLGRFERSADEFYKEYVEHTFPQS